jgi:hypothetical protein
VIASGGQAASSASWGVTPQAQKTGTSPGASETSPIASSGAPRSTPSAAGSPTWTGAPCSCG